MPTLVTLDEARFHCKSDAADDTILTVYVEAAEKAVARLANRTIYANQGLLTAALVGVLPALAAANTAYDDAVLAAEALDSADATLDAIRVAKANLNKVRSEQDAVLHGIVASDDIKAAVLLMTGHLYRNREEVVAGQGAAVAQIPMGARALMEPYRNLGPL